jgi:hypothetical protein
MANVTCFVCRATIDGDGHKPACPVLEEELEAFRLLAALPSAMEVLDNPR